MRAAVSCATSASVGIADAENRELRLSLDMRVLPAATSPFVNSRFAVTVGGSLTCMGTELSCREVYIMSWSRSSSVVFDILH